VPYRVLSGDQHPDHDTISEFRKRHLTTFSHLFLDVLALCEQAGLVKLGHVSLDGSKVKANASKHKAMSYGRMCEKEKSLKEEVKKLLDEAERADLEEVAPLQRNLILTKQSRLQNRRGILPIRIRVL